MELIDWIIIGVVVVALATIVWLVSRKWKQMTLIDIKAMPKASMRLKKYRMIEKRLERKTKGALGEAKKVFNPAGGAIGEKLKKAYDKLHELERKYRHADTTPKTQEEKEQSRVKITELMDSAAAFVKEEKYAEAETAYVDVIRLDERNVEAYTALGDVYWKRKDYDHAFETLEFAKKLDPKNDKLYYVLAQIHESRDDKLAALDNYKEAVELAPKSPRNLTALITAALAVNEKLLARQTLSKLREANPDNNRIEEFEQELKGL